MKGYTGNIFPFWKEDLETYVSTQTTPIAPHAVPHINYKEPAILLKQSFNEDLPACWTEFYKALNVEEGNVCWLNLTPREMIPVHRDYFFVLKTKKKVDVDRCIRYLIMLEDWMPGHMVQLDDLVLTNWKAGDVWYFDNEVLHWAANCGTTNFYSCQVSTLK